MVLLVKCGDLQRLGHNSSNPYNAVDYRFFIWRPGAILGEITMDYKQPLPWIIMITTDPIALNFDSLWRVWPADLKGQLNLMIYLIFVLLFIDLFSNIGNKYQWIKKLFNFFLKIPFGRMYHKDSESSVHFWIGWLVMKLLAKQIFKGLSWSKEIIWWWWCGIF